ncbi:hypothetical protein J8273_8484 [Carpediemonas membranifera]|uniref:Uncharacterized protein n=1 Tax=Carpediemonas membranifera TaxID=201153 RepID=A0A8J6ART7_9EUKA|nr:hypothetical protein J8273_8484 [Carpediemonas membranifera]|eukprot:KAG9389805.1 hypothetical protein J8273_8484 [Carpediemonas membranifera]
MINIQSIRNCCAPLSTTALWIFAEHHTMWVNVLVITRTNSLVGGVAVRADDDGAILVNHVKIDDNVIPLEKGYYLSRELSIWRARNEHTSRRGESRAPVEDFQANGGGDANRTPEPVGRSGRSASGEGCGSQSALGGKTYAFQLCCAGLELLSLKSD